MTEHSPDNEQTNPTEAEIAQAAEVLSRLSPGFLPFQVFHEVARLTTTPIVEVVPLRAGPSGEVQILLLERDKDDPVWPGQLHVPGTTVRASDVPGSFDSALERVLSGELVGTPTGRPMYVENILHHSGRGMEASQVYWVEVAGEPTVGTFYDVEHLPDTVVTSQMDFIPDAILHFKQYVAEAPVL